MIPSHERTMATVDERRARLFRCSLTDRGAWRIRETETLRSVWEQDHERGRPAVLGAGAGTVPPHQAGVGHGEAEERRRFARDVSRWLTRKSGEPGAGPVLVFAAPRFLGELRQLTSDLPSQRLRLVESELTRLAPDELAGHPAVLAHLSGPAGG